MGRQTDRQTDCRKDGRGLTIRRYLIKFILCKHTKLCVIQVANKTNSNIHSGHTNTQPHVALRHPMRLVTVSSNDALRFT
jgi:hypothetical protein